MDICRCLRLPKFASEPELEPPQQAVAEVALPGPGLELPVVEALLVVLERLAVVQEHLAVVDLEQVLDFDYLETC